MGTANVCQCAIHNPRESVKGQPPARVNDYLCRGCRNQAGCIAATLSKIGEDLPTPEAAAHP